jgi:hypothetical protein
MRVQDRAWLTATELALIESREPPRIRAYSPAQLNDRIARARRLWDKYRGLAREQVREERRRTRPQAKPVSKSPGRPVAQRGTIRRKKQQGQASNEAALASRITRQFQKSKIRAVHGHISARGKRRQATCDAR